MSNSATKQQYCCTICHRRFTKRSALNSHAKSTHPRCGRCKKQFDGFEHLQSHQKETGHLYCGTCDLSFSEKSARKRHTETIHPSCVLCHKRFDWLEHLQSHKKETGHLYCSECDLYFISNRTHIVHVRVVQHTAQYHCCDCDRDYNSQKSLDNHCCDCDRVFRARKLLKRHFGEKPTHLSRVKDPSVLHKCKKCDEEFPTKEALRKHKKLKHKALRRIPCSINTACTKKFITPAGLLNHLESGRCRSGMTQAKMHELVLAHDQSYHITDIGAMLASSGVQESASQLPHTRSTSILASPAQLDLIRNDFNANIDDDTASEWSLLDAVTLRSALSESDSDWSVPGGVPLGPAISESGGEWSLVSPILMPTASIISDIDIERLPEPTLLQNLRCPRCPPSRKPFCNSRALQAHISSAAHSPKIFHCPLAFVPDVSPINKRKKERYFSTLAGLARHLECGACQGGAATFVNVINYVQDQLKSLGFENVRLLLD